MKTLEFDGGTWKMGRWGQNIGPKMLHVSVGGIGLEVLVWRLMFHGA
jgi:hypothetical protein